MRKIFEIQLGTVAHFLDEIGLARTTSDKFRIQIEASRIVDRIDCPDMDLRRHMDYLALAIFMDDDLSEAWKTLEFLRGNHGVRVSDVQSRARKSLPKTHRKHR